MLGFFDSVSPDDRAAAIARVNANGVNKSSAQDLSIVQRAASQAGSTGRAAQAALEKK